MDVLLGYTDSGYTWLTRGSDVVGETDAATQGALYGKIANMTQVLSNAGFPKSSIMYAVAQVMFESNWGSSTVARNLNNYSGIKYIENNAQNATKGTISPEGNFYARFKTIGEWAKDYRRILSINGPFGPPIAATTVADFLKRLRANKYFTDVNYERNYNPLFSKIVGIVQWYNSGGKNATVPIKYTDGPGNPTKPVTPVTPGGQVITYAPDPTGRVDEEGNPTGVHTGLDDFWHSDGKGGKKHGTPSTDWSLKAAEQWASKNPLKTALIAVAVGFGIKKLAE